ncbi:MAG: MFS transporter [Chitinophagaceae bacterium]|nr:MFS transporter [Chitinophagaceae bacterium]
MRQLAPVQFFTWMGLFCMWIFFGVTITRSVFGYKDTTLKQDLIYESTKAAAQIRLGETIDKDSDDYKKNRKELNKYFNNPNMAYPAFLGVPMDSIIRSVPTVAATYGEEFKEINNKIRNNNQDPKSEKIELGSLLEEQERSGTSVASLLDEYRLNKKRREDGGEWGGNCFAFYSLVTFLFAFFLPVIANKIGKKKTHFICLLAGGIGLLAIWGITNKYALFLTMTGIGIAWASILSMPYAMLSNKIPQEKMGIFMGIFNFFIVIPEIITALSFDWILEHIFDWNRTIFVAMGGILMFIAALFCLRVTESD